MTKFKIGSLFDGSGGFPLAASMCGIEPTWAAEVEPYPIAVTQRRFPNMKHLGSVTDINGGEIEPVDIITFGSPCQGLSQAGLRKGLDDDRSGLFMEAVRIIKEMREATNGRYPTFALWENVPGAFSSNKGEDFRTVCEELIKIVETGAVMPAVPQKGWPYADSYCGDGWSLAYRVFDAQYWGVPQRRRRIHLVLDLRGERAGKVLFERDGLCRNYPESGAPWQATAGDAESGIGADDREGECVALYQPMSLREENWAECNVRNALRAGESKVSHAVVYSIENHPADSRVSIDESGKVQTLTSRMGTGGGNVPMVMEAKPVYCLQGNGIDRADTAGCNGKGWTEDVSYTLNTIDRPAVCYADTYQKTTGPLMANSHPGSYSGQDAYTDMFVVGKEEPRIDTIRYIVRRLTPIECARLQGFADRWGDIDEKDSFTPEEYAFWHEVRNTHAAINGKKVQEYTETQMLTWYNKLHTDSAEYKMWGNGIALPPALYCMQGMAEALEAEQ